MRKLGIAAAAFVGTGTTYGISQAASNNSWEKYGPQYESQTAYQKQKELWGWVIQNQKPYGWYSALSMVGLFTESMSPSLHFVGDTFEYSWWGIRKKLLHSVGGVAQVRFESVSNQEGYTGIFEGADYGFIRLSSATEPNTKNTTPQGALGSFAPGMGLKFLRDNKPSASLVAMYSVEGQASWNFFKNDFSNHIGGSDQLKLRALGCKFATGTPFNQYIGVSDFARIGQDGKEVKEFKFPFQLIFEPVLRDDFPDDFKEDYLETFKKIKPGTTLYRVMALKEPGSPKVHIGNLITTSAFVPTEFGDRYLFFKHQDMREDVKIRPDWAKYLVDGSKGCPFAEKYDPK